MKISLTKIKEICQTILHNNEYKELVGKDLWFIKEAILPKHEDYKGKMAEIGNVVKITSERNKEHGNTFSFYLYNNKGESVDFSFNKCITKATMTPEYAEEIYIKYNES